MRTRILLFTLGIFISNVVPMSVSAQEKTVFFKGHVILDQQPCEGATIKVCKYVAENDCSFIVYEAIVGKDGRFEFELLPTGPFLLTIGKEGLSERKITIENVLPKQLKYVGVPPFEFDVSMDADAERHSSISFDAERGAFIIKPATK